MKLVDDDDDDDDAIARPQTIVWRPYVLPLAFINHANIHPARSSMPNVYQTWVLGLTWKIHSHISPTPNFYRMEI